MKHYSPIIAGMLLLLLSFCVWGQVSKASTEYENNDSFQEANDLLFSQNGSEQIISKVDSILEDRYDHDYYRINLDKPGKIDVKITDHQNTKFGVKLYLSANGSPEEDWHTSYNQHSTTNQIFSSGLDKGQYYIVVDYYDGEDEKVPYTLEVDYTPSQYYEKENNDNLAQANSVNLNQIYNGFADSSASDYYTFKVTDNGETNIKLLPSKSTKFSVQLYNASEERLEDWYTYYSEDTDMINIIDTGLSPGNYYLRIKAYDGDNYNVPYSFSVNFKKDAFFEKEPNDDMSQSDNLELNQVRRGTISSSSDIDYYRLNLKKNTSMGLYLTRPVDTRFGIRIFDQDGNYYEDSITNYGQGTNDRLSNVSLKAGTYFVKIYYYEGEHRKVPYTLKITERDTTPPPTPKVNAITDKHTVITGTGEPNTTILIKKGNTLFNSGKVGSNGRFSISIPKIKGGTSLQISNKDLEGNESRSVSIKVKDTTPPANPTVNKVTHSNVYISGKTEPSVKVVIKLGSKIIASGTSNSKGAYYIKIGKQKSGNSLSITAIDTSGNQSHATVIKVK